MAVYYCRAAIHCVKLSTFKNSRSEEASLQWFVLQFWCMILSDSDVGMYRLWRHLLCPFSFPLTQKHLKIPGKSVVSSVPGSASVQPCLLGSYLFLLNHRSAASLLPSALCQPACSLFLRTGGQMDLLSLQQWDRILQCRKNEKNCHYSGRESEK